MIFVNLLRIFKGFMSSLVFFWFKLPEKLRFLLVGGYNTLSSLIFFWLVSLCFGAGSYLLALAINHLITVTQSFLTFKLFVFRADTSGFLRHEGVALTFGKLFSNFLPIKNSVLEYARAHMVYVFYFLVNSIMLYFFVDFCGFGVMSSQIISVAILTSAVFVLHKFFTFKNAKP